MKLAKRLFALALVLCMVFCLSAAVFAADGDATDEKQDITDKYDKAPVVTKTYKVNNGTAPAEEFEFKFEAVSYKNTNDEVVNTVTIPDIGNVKISFDALTATDTKTVSPTGIDADDYAELGVYTYKVTEVIPETKTAGVTYTETPLYLVLTILRDEQNDRHYVAAMHYETVSGDKSTGFTNEYDAGSLSVTKKITGNMANMNKKFTFTINFTAPTDTEIKSTISAGDAQGTWTNNGLTYTIELGNNDTVTFTNIPAGTTYTVTEDADGYQSSSVFSDETYTISANDADTVTFTNDFTKGIDTGISLDSLPYILALAAACAGAVVMFTRKRRVED